jgi:hypothetical protein
MKNLGQRFGVMPSAASYISTRTVDKPVRKLFSYPVNAGCAKHTSTGLPEYSTVKDQSNQQITTLLTFQGRRPYDKA